MAAGSTKTPSFKATIHSFFTKTARHYQKHDNIYTPLLLSIIIGVIGIILKIYQLHSIGMWDEGWYVDIMRTMSETGNWFLPVYYMDGESVYLGPGNTYSWDGGAIFDKPPLLFWFGSISASIFGFTSFAAKFPMALSSGLVGVVGFFIYDVNKKEGAERVAGVFTGLMASFSYFIAVYGRTAYLDANVIFFSALTVVLAMRAFDNALEGKYRRGTVYAVLLWLVMTASIFAKAWQGLIVGPPIAIYIISRFCNRFFKKEYAEELYIGFKEQKVEFSEYYLSEAFGVLSGIGTYILVNLFSEEPRYFSLDSLGVPFQLNILAVMAGLLTVFFVKLLCDSIKSASTRNQAVLKIFGYFIIALGSLGGAFAGIKINDMFISAFDRVIEEILTGLDFPELADPTTIIISTALFGVTSFLVIFIASILAGAIIFGDQRHTGLFLNALLLVPLGVAGSWTVYWFLFVLLKGQFFNREPVATLLAGISVPLILIAIALFLLLIVKWSGSRKFIEETGPWKFLSPYFSVSGIDYSKFFLFFCFVLVLITLSFYPLNAWIWYIDSNIESIGLPIRVPGELWKYIDELPETGISMEYIFYEYYIGWRYTHETKYDLFNSLHGLKGDPIFVIGLPFFIMGIYYFIKTRDFSKGLLLTSWLIFVLVAFLPSAFQLDYYYLAVFLPYYAVVAKGMVESMREHSGAQIRDYKEKLILLLPFFAILLVPVAGYLMDLLNTADLLEFLNSTLGYFWQDQILISTVLFTITAILICRTVPGMITLMITIPYLTGVLLANHLRFRNTFLLFLIIACISFWLYQERSAFQQVVENNRLLKKFKEKLMDFSRAIQSRNKILANKYSLEYLVAILLLAAAAVFALAYVPYDITIELFIFVIFLAAGALLSLSRKYPVKSLFLVLLILMTSAASVSKLVYYNERGDLRFDECASFILSHGGGFNYSTWVFDESGAKYAMRYLLGYRIVVEKDYQNPFRLNNVSLDDTLIDTYRNWFNEYLSATTAKFWVIITIVHWDRTPMPAYTTTWSWFVSNPHIEDVSSRAGLPEYCPVRLYANVTWLNEMGY
ncbi:MAG: ArnT family glycosyltransferase [Candidatus Odinarchaeota archaeon]